MNKYYTPTIEEFHVGFEYERFIPQLHTTIDERWEELTMSVNFLSLDEIDNEIITKEIRVKYLDQEDIESLGFNKLDKNSKYIEHGWTHSSDTHLLNFRELDRMVQILHIKREMLVFVGWIKNKSELKKTLEMLNIKYD